MDEIPKYDPSNERIRAVLSCRAVYYAVKSLSSCNEINRTLCVLSSEKVVE